ncbi:hypothetical protein JDV02_010008 [Purpureocillium takamizusanense]|uniref:Exosome complex protein n=1 Tax=Purpureocillium takamizusanense TaxID=2060973 RepID=A0A9Q8VET6_9HYPO|nr:uncharacterized protein JDV02_010008 [Purpureocillium takamizusanense]UNI24245.1 hypothetical protein JDV02_010008 [Purpureocillium takamizusanense]
MAESKGLVRDLDKLDVQLDNLEDALGPLLEGLDERASQLPLLDRAKLFSLSAYAIESLLFASLKLQGTDAQSHAVFTELKRVQQYFAKIKGVEEPEPQGQRSTTVNQEAAARILKADLADNKALSAKLAEKIAEERAKALLKSVEGGSGKKSKRAADDSASAGEASTDQGGKKKKHKHGKKSRR